MKAVGQVNFGCIDEDGIYTPFIAIELGGKVFNFVSDSSTQDADAARTMIKAFYEILCESSKTNVQHSPTGDLPNIGESIQ